MITLPSNNSLGAQQERANTDGPAVYVVWLIWTHSERFRPPHVPRFDAISEAPGPREVWALSNTIAH